MIMTWGMLYDCTKVHRKYYMYLDVWTRDSRGKGVGVVVVEWDRRGEVWEAYNGMRQVEVGGWGEGKG